MFPVELRSNKIIDVDNPILRINSQSKVAQCILWRRKLALIQFKALKAFYTILACSRREIWLLWTKISKIRVFFAESVETFVETFLQVFVTI